MSPNTSCSRFCSTFPADVIPNGIHLKRLRPHGVWNVHNRLDRSVSLTCLLASFIPITVKILLSASCACTSSAVGIMYGSRFIAWFNGLGFKHSLSCPLYFCEITRLLTHSDRPSASSMTPSASNFVRAFFSLECCVIGTQCTDCITGVTDSSSSMSYGSGNYPCPLKLCWNSRRRPVSVNLGPDGNTYFKRFMSPMASDAHLAMVAQPQL